MRPTIYRLTIKGANPGVEFQAVIESSMDIYNGVRYLARFVQRAFGKDVLIGIESYQEMQVTKEDQ